MNSTNTLITLNYDIENLAFSLLSTNWKVDGVIYNLKKLNWNFNFNTKKRALGTCNFTKKEISLSESLILTNPEIDLWDDTLRHEIAHAIDYIRRGKSDHSKTWKDIGRQVGCDTDCLKASVNANLVSGKYTTKCDTCKTEKPLHRKRRRSIACSKCCKEHNNGNYSDKFKLSITQNY